MFHSTCGDLVAAVTRSGSLLRLHGSQSVSDFWSAIQAVLREAMPYDALVVHLNFLDFTSSWRAAKVLMTPNARHPTLWFEKRWRVDVMQRFVMSQAPGLRLYRLSDVIADADELRRTPFFRNHLAPSGWHFIAVQLYWRGNTVRSEVAIRRTKEQGDFTDREIDALEDLHPHIEIVLNRLIELEEERARRRRLEDFNEHLPFALLSLGWALEPVFASHEALEQCALWNYGPRDARRYTARAILTTPAPIISACTSLKMEWLALRGAKDARAGEKVTLVVPHPAEPGLSAAVTLCKESRCPTAHPGFLVQLRTLGATRSDQTFAAQELLMRLTHAERELARHVCQGLGNREIAENLNKSVLTVKAQLTSVYRKLRVPSRSRLLADFARIIQ